MKSIKIYLKDWQYLTTIKGETEKSYADIIKGMMEIYKKLKKKYGGNLNGRERI